MAPVTQPLTTIFLIPSIHCSTCATFIETLLRQIDPEALVETSIISHSVTIRHSRDANLEKMTLALGNAGYEVDTVVMDPESRPPSDPAVRAAASDVEFMPGWFGRAVKRWNPAARVSQKNAHRRHMEICVECRSKHKAEVSEQQIERASEDSFDGSAVVIDSDSSAPQPLQATVSIEGMSCSSCVGKITDLLLSHSWVEAADIALLTRTALVRFYGADNAPEIVQIIEDGGYDAKIEQVETLGGVARARETSGDIWRAELSITGMSCSSCVGEITRAVETQPWVKTVDVNLLTSSATVIFEDKSHLGELISIIDTTGYGVKLSDLVNTSAAEGRDAHRKVQIRIDEMYCELCPNRVSEALRNMGSPLDIDRHATLDNPIVTVSYTPEAPKFTIRTILSAISAADGTFRPAIYHPPTIEDRSRQMHARSRRRLLYRLLLSIAAAIPGLIIGIVYMALVSKHDPNRMYLMEKLHGVSRAEWSLLVISTLVYFFGADIFHRRTIKEIYAMWKPGSHVPMLRRFYRFGSMDMLVSFATTIAYFASIAELVVAATGNQETDMPEKMPYFDSVIFLTMFLLAGRMIEAYSKARTGEAVTKLGDLRPKEALLVVPSDEKEGGNQTTKVPIDTLESGDTVVVVHGGSPPWDGILLDKEAEFAEASLTGESRPVIKSTGDEVYSGTVNKGGPIAMRIHGAAGESLLDNIIRIVREGQSKRAPIERVADTITGYFVPFVTLVAIVTWLTWLGLGISGRLPQSYLDAKVGGWPFWSLQFAIAIFVIACPCGIGLAAPTALFVGGGLAAKHGILAKGGGEAFQEASAIDIVVFDKTGTLTEGGELKLTDHILMKASTDKWGEETLLACLGEMERSSSHPIGKALVAFCEEKGLKGLAPRQVEEIPGKGMKASFSGDTVSTSIEMIAGNEALMTDYGVAFDQETISSLDSWKGQAKSVVLVAARDVNADDSWVPVAIFSASDPIRPESRSVIEALHARGVDVWMISGDNPKTAHSVGAVVSMTPDRIIAGVLPEEKADKVKYLQGSQTSRQTSSFNFGRSGRQRAIVAMVGDGVNDSPALTAADVGIAIGAGSDVAISAAEFVLIKSNLNSLLTLVELSRVVFRRVKFNFAWASVYNLIALPIAAGVLYPIRTNGSHTRLDPVWASLAMALSSVSVICSSLLLRTSLPVVGFRNSLGSVRKGASASDIERSNNGG